MKRSTTFLAASLLIAAAVMPVVAGENSHEGIPPEMMRAMMPGEAQHHIAGLAGHFTFSGNIREAPDAPEQTFTGTRSARMIMGGRYLLEEVHSTFMGMPMEGMGLMAYDNVAGHYIYTWIDNMGTGVTTSTGSYADGTWALSGKHLDPMTKKMTSYRNVLRLNADGTIVFEWHEGGFKMMEITYTPKQS